MKYIIYKITIQDYVYIGSTKNFIRRKSQHKSDCNLKKDRLIYKTINELGGWEKCEMIPIEECECDSNIQAHIREEHHRQLNNANLNSIRCHRTDADYKECKKIKDKKYRESHKESLTIKKKEYYEANKEWINEHNKEYYESNKDLINIHQKEYREINKVKLYVRNKELFELNKDDILKKRKEYYELNKDKILREKKQCLQTDRDRINARRRELRKEKNNTV